ncbi:hypothetical protein GUITHDRAFT_114235 [Guillardia theta CCMP2712]|uniref:Uncharacterized protein n=1 Tax=Guillardia theta (strain CCMP2712) TaxID=905079 RepID=L1IUF1_GUITC|nr:hypothetical protein GUITHDRAFT_114235 [Guillardia theta CCMP2712]EKX39737.1 hypothetical protein GUITHDRAFT_114235 [Guillardia theta CCMP2712]|eukprot:XP_005826717.1 hypothetical protein GUITHDRAFT_114235 [Guillardia theta CCMP2712]
MAVAMASDRVSDGMALFEDVAMPARGNELSSSLSILGDFLAFAPKGSTSMVVMAMRQQGSGQEGVGVRNKTSIQCQWSISSFCWSTWQAAAVLLDSGAGGIRVWRVTLEGEELLIQSVAFFDPCSFHFDSPPTPAAPPSFVFHELSASQAAEPLVCASVSERKGGATREFVLLLAMEAKEAKEESGEMSLETPSPGAKEAKALAPSV